MDEYIRYGGTLRAGEIHFGDRELNAEDALLREIRGRYVLYRGGDAEAGAGVIYQNVENYLKLLWEGISVM